MPDIDRELYKAAEQSGCLTCLWWIVMPFAAVGIIIGIIGSITDFIGAERRVLLIVAGFTAFLGLFVFLVRFDQRAMWKRHARTYPAPEAGFTISPEGETDMDADRESWTIDDIRREFERYCDLVNASDRAPNTKTTYIQHADRFVRWLAGEIEI